MAVEQHSCRMALGPGGPEAGPASAGPVYCPTLVCPVLCQSALACAALLWQDGVSAQPQIRTQPCLQWKGKVRFQSQRGAGLHRPKSLPLVPNWSVLRQMRTPNPCSFIGPKGTVLIGQNRAYSGWSELHGFNWMGKALLLLVERRFQETFIRADSDGRTTVQAGSSVQASP